MGNNPSQELEKQIFNLKLTAKTLAKQSSKMEVQAKKDRLSVKNAIEKGNADVAKIHAENSIRNKNQSLNFLKLSSRMEAVAQRIDASRNMQNLGISMGNVVDVMGMAIQNMDMEKLTTTMDQFEKQFEQLDIQSAVMDKSIQQSIAQTTPEDQVDTLLRSVADEYGLELAGDVDSIQVPKNKEKDEEKKIGARLESLKNNK